MKNNVLLETLYRACSMKRPAGGVGESKLAADTAVEFKATMIDGAGNIHFDRRVNGERSLFCAHLDSVSHQEGPNAIKQDGRFWRASGDVLGADDGAGVALIAHMLYTGVSGYFVLFRSEETGGLGSKWLADNMPDLLMQFDRAIAFDRAGYYDVITHQAGVRCCSDEFAEALSQQLSFDESGLMFMPSDAGVYTDTAEFTELIPCCTNLSVGYFLQHSTNEYQDVEYLRQLAWVLCLVDWESLPVARNAAEKGNLRAGWAEYGVTKVHKTLGPEEHFTDNLTDFGEEEYDLYESIVYAKDTGRYAGLTGTICELLDIEEKINVSNLTGSVLDSAAGALLNGSCAYDVAQDLYEITLS